ncbi:MAG: hypothetical protein HY298_03890 [Verrucomicrobia bacterium]|nr:hypothetical protein [Verrucomicrobiota bacterium]
MSVTLADVRKKPGHLAGKAQSRVETLTVKQRSATAKLESVQRHSEILTAQWRTRRKTILLNPKGLPRLSVAKLIQRGRK